MARFVLTWAAAIAAIGIAWPWLSRLGFGRLPGDLRFEWRGRAYAVPLATSLVLSAALTLLLRLAGR